MRTAIATQEAVDQAVNDLAADGVEPTVERVKNKLGGGSYSTINKLIPNALARLKAETIKVAELPPEIARLSADLAARMASEVYGRVGSAANARVAEVEAECRDQVAKANTAREEAGREIERLEGELTRSEEALAHMQAAATQANSRAATAEGRIVQLEAELARLGEAVSTAQAAERTAIETAAELRGQIAQLEKLITKSSGSRPTGKKS